jgi:hypothetical protein
MEWAFPYMEDIWVGLDRLEFQTGSEHSAKGLRSEWADRELNTAYQTSAAIFEKALVVAMSWAG